MEKTYAPAKAIKKEYIELLNKSVDMVATPSLIKDSVSQIEHGSEIADKSGAVLSNIVNSVKKVSDLNNEIAAASSEQTTGFSKSARR
ncbi:methyl-accepting chemotaxis protein [Bdellovibrio sp. BCCA]|uniref:methyl-accepting chemotaxis protein n=1 Tax=Bdellovibrio sp. BCCA TaxID=3136281 RepID=UPI0030F11F8C